MTEEEIVNYLKENKSRGTIFAFMPKDVKSWCDAHQDERIFLIFSGDCWSNKSIISCANTSTYCLPDGYKPEAEFEPHWEEFEIDKVGGFTYKKAHRTVSCLWWHWQAFLADNSDKYNYFGGWQYGGSWELSLNITNSVGRRLHSYLDLNKDNIKPVIPTKIRFWRYRE